MQIQLSTPFGPVTYTIAYDERGRLLTVNSSSANLTAVMRKITYGERADQAGRYFTALTENVRYTCSVLPHLGGAPKPYASIAASIREMPPSPAVPPATAPAAEPSVTFWRKYPKLHDALFFVPGKMDRGLQRMASDYKNWSAAAPEQLRALEPWAMTLFDLVDVSKQHLVWKILGLLGTDTAADYMLNELERPGFHPRGRYILQGLACGFIARRDAERLLALGKRKEYVGENAGLYLSIVGKVTSPKAVEVARHILFRQVNAAAEALNVFEHNGVKDPIQILHEAFSATEEFWVVFRYVEFLRELAPPGRHISLATLNEKLAEPAFTETAPVTWQQQLSPVWKTLLDDTGAEERLRVIQEQIVQRTARQQYNALLQLNYVIRQFPGTEPNGRILERLNQLVSHRYDKVAAGALAAIRKLIDQIPNRHDLNERLLPISTAPGLRVAKLKVLKTLGQDPPIAAAQRDYFQKYLKQDLTPDQKLVTTSIIKYLKLDIASRTN